MIENNQTDILYQPSPAEISQCKMNQFLMAISKNTPEVSSYKALHQWSIENAEEFWLRCADFCELQWIKKPTEVFSKIAQPPYGIWFKDGVLNYAQHCLRGQDGQTVLIAVNENGLKKSYTRKELKSNVLSMACWLKNQGINKGDVVAGVLPNGPEAIIGHLAAAAIGAVWVSAAVEFGAQAICERLSQVEPKVLIFAESYQYGGKIYQQKEKLHQIINEIKSIGYYVSIEHTMDDDLAIDGFIFSDCIQYSNKGFEYEPLPFNHPLTIVFSSGTTGVPKCIVHSTGGTLIQHLKEHQLHLNISENSRLMYFTTCGWMMWNWQLAALASHATIITYDGSPFYPTEDILFSWAEDLNINILGLSARYLTELEKRHIVPQSRFKLDSLDIILSTGSPLYESSYQFVYQNIKKQLRLESISGGTDILSCFGLGNPLLPIRSGQITSIGLGMNVDIFDEAGHPCKDKKGLLVCKNSCPSMPIYFMKDQDTIKYTKAYYDQFPNIWVHGDYAKITPNRTLIIFGRSDTTLNPSGVRIGTAEIYNQLQKIDSIQEAVAVTPMINQKEVFVLFIQMIEGKHLTGSLKSKINSVLKNNCSPRHVPDIIIQAPEFPTTISGKIMEKVVKQCCEHSDIININAVKNKHCLNFFVSISPSIQNIS